MNFLFLFPLIRIALFFLLGTISGHFFRNLIDFSFSVGILIFLVLSYVVCYVLNKKFRHSAFRLLLGILGLTCVFFMGFTHIKISNEYFQNHHFGKETNISAYVARVKTIPSTTQKTIKYLVEVEYIKIDTWKKSKGNLILYVSKKHTPIYNLNDRVLVYATPNLIKRPTNPNQFDYKNYLSNKYIYHQQFVFDNIELLSSESSYNISEQFIVFRMYALQIIEQLIEGEREQQVAKALLLGYKDDLSNEVKNTYQSSGISHILAVSGLHVGMLYLLIVCVLKKVAWIKNKQFLIISISLFALWIYAAITGFSASVLRSTTMFSFVCISQNSSKQTNFYNTLSGSIILLLLINPNFIFSVGFQLSYLAVIGIVFLQPIFSRIYQPDNGILKFLWGIVTVSISAQITTFPLIIYYFNVYPSLSLFTNIIAIPVTYGILIIGIIMIIFSKIQLFSFFLGKILYLLIFCLNELVYFVDTLTFSHVEDIYLSTTQIFLLYSIIFSSFLFYGQKSKLLYYFTVALILGYFVERMNWILSNFKSKDIIFYSVPNHTAIELIINNQAFLLTDSLLSFKTNDFQIKPNHIAKGLESNLIQHYKYFNQDKSFLSIEWKNKKIGIVSHIIREYKPSELMNLNYLILTEGYEGNLEKLKEQFNFDTLIFDNTLTRFRLNTLKKDAKKMKIPFHSLSDKGYLKITL